jgi:mercuric ion binding protein
MPALLVLIAVVGAGPASATEQRVTLAVENMSCPTCPLIVKRALANIAGVRDVRVSYEQKTAVVIYDDGSATPTALIEASTRAGFPARVKP